MTMQLPANVQPVTAVISHRVKPGREQGYEVWLKGISAAAQGFAGFQGVSYIRPHDHQHPEYVSILKFDSYTHLRTWLESAERQDWLARSRPLVDKNPEVQVLTGLETWFTLPNRTSPPPPHKMAIITWIGVQMMTTLVVTLLGPYLMSLPLFINLAISNVVVVLALTYIVMPQLTRLFRRWLYP